MKILFVLFPLLIECFGGTATSQTPKTLKTKKADSSELAPSTIDKPIAFLDAHVHLNDVSMQLELMAHHGINQAVVFWGRNSTNQSISDAVFNQPDKFIPFVSVSPERAKYRDLWLQQDPKLLTILEELLENGVFKGIGEMSIAHFPSRGFPESNFSPVSPLMKGVMELARKYKVPVMIHCEITWLKEISELLDDFEDVNVIWAHGGYTPYFVAKRMLDKHPNLYYDLSARTWRNHPRSPDYTIFKNDTQIWPQWLELIESYAERFLVGTDASHHSIEREQMKIASVQLLLRQLSQETRTLVAKDNLLRLVR